MKNRPASRPWHRPILAVVGGFFLLLYFASVLVYRYSLRGTAGAMDMLWACNVALMVAAYGMLSRQADWISGAVGMIAMAHFLWMLDVALFLLTGSFPIGLASYLNWPSTARLEVLTTLHHVWFIPLCYAVLHKNGRLNAAGWRLSLIAGLVLIVLSRLITPLRAGDLYLNVNLAHEFWRDVSVPALHQFDPPSTPWPIYVIFTLIIMNTVNTVLYLFWRQVQSLISRDGPKYA